VRDSKIDQVQGGAFEKVINCQLSFLYLVVDCFFRSTLSLDLFFFFEGIDLSILRLAIETQRGIVSGEVV